MMKPWTFYALFLFPCFVLAQTPRLVVPVGHIGYIADITISTDRKWVLTSSPIDGTKLWDQKGRVVTTVPALSYVNAFSPDGQHFLTADTGNTLVMWDLSGRLKQRFSGHSGRVDFVALTPDGKSVVSSDDRGKMIFWNLEGKQLRTISDIRNPTITQDGKFIVSADKYTVFIRDIKGNLILQFEDPALKEAEQNSRRDLGNGAYLIIPTESFFTSVSISPDQKYIVTGTYDGQGAIWSWQGEKLHEFRSSSVIDISPDGGHLLSFAYNSNSAQLMDWSGQVIQIFTFKGMVGNARFTPDGKNVLISIEKNLFQLDLQGHIVKAFTGHSLDILSLALSPDNTFLAAGCCDNYSARIWKFKEGKAQGFNYEGQPLFRHCFEAPITISPDAKMILNVRDNNVAQLWDLNGVPIQTFIDQEESISALAFTPNGNEIITGNRLYRARKWNIDGQELHNYPMDMVNSSVESVDNSSDNTMVVTGSANLDNQVRIWNTSGDLLRKFSTEVNQIYDVKFSPDNKTVLVGGYEPIAQLFDLDGNKLVDFRGHSGSIKSVSFSIDGKLVLTGSVDGTARIWNLNGHELQRFVGHENAIFEAVFFSKGKMVLTGSRDNTMKLWDVQTGANLATLIFIDADDWVVTTPNGLFDASDGAKRLMFYLSEYKDEQVVIGLEQLQERYWQPGLLGAIMGLTPFPVRDVGVFDNLRLFPAFDESTRIESGQLHIKLRERNGGLGKLSLIINGARREENLNPNQKKDLKIDLKTYAKYFRTDTLNTIELEVYESQNFLKSEPYILQYQASVNKRGEGENARQVVADCQSPRHLYLIVVGTSLYPQGVDSLPSAQEDAVEMARVLSESGKQLYDDRVHLKLLSTRAGMIPSKSNIEAAFRAFQDSANVCDVLVVFFAGHGSNWGKEGDKSNFYYLTKDITFNKLNDDGIRKAYAISDQELTEWMTKIPAQNQLLILDACNSGQAAINMGGIVSRNLDPDKILAFNLMSGNTGSYVISGSSESGASFESEVYGHGLLTYSLLEGINGTALDGSKVDVLPLLLKSYKRVEELAQSLGKEQTPIIAKPRGNSSFYVGRNDGSIQIDLPESKPMVIRSIFWNQNSYVDHLRIAEELNTIFLSKVIKGKQAPWFYSDIPEHPQGFSVRGTYLETSDHQVRVKGCLIYGETPVGEPFEVAGTNNPKVIADLIYKAVRPGIKLK
ncbi:MAG TPA: caspase family protein [Saprospiraceae bacterium]|nr:caspase family protein [Saprospiraceae bacterium]